MGVNEWVSVSVSVCAIINQLVTFFNIRMSAWPTLQLTLTQMKLAAIAAAVVVVVAILGMQKTHFPFHFHLHCVWLHNASVECKCESNCDCKCKCKCILQRVFAPRLTNLSLPTSTLTLTLAPPLGNRAERCNEPNLAELSWAETRPDQAKSGHAEAFTCWPKCWQKQNIE